jgi:hypothetical protein
MLVPLFLSIGDVPNLFGYRFFDLILGVVVGGVSWIVHRLLIEAEELRLRDAVRARRPNDDEKPRRSPSDQRRLRA